MTMTLKEQNEKSKKEFNTFMHRLNVYHCANLTSEFLPQTFTKVNSSLVGTTSKLIPVNKLSVYQESEFVYTNPNKEKDKEENFNYKFNSLVSVNDKLIVELYKQDDYMKLFQNFNLYLRTLFSDQGKEEVIKLYLNKKITDSVYIYTMKCYELVERNTKLYNYFKTPNSENLFETTENFYYIRTKKNMSLKEDILLYISKFQTLLGIAGEFEFKEEIEKLKILYKAIEKIKKK